MNKTHFIDWGLIDYQIAWDKQEAILKEKIDLKLSQRKLSAENQTPIENHLIFYVTTFSKRVNMRMFAKN